MRRGESSLDPANLGQAQEAVKLSELIEPADNNLVLVDVTPVNRTRNFHNFSLETPEFFDDLFLRLINQDMPESRELYFLETPAGVRYFVLTRGGRATQTTRRLVVSGGHGSGSRIHPKARGLNRHT